MSRTTCGPLYQRQLDFYVDGDPEKARPFAAGFVSGQAEKVYLGACLAAMFRPSQEFYEMVYEIARQASMTYELNLRTHDEFEIWLIAPAGMELFGQMRMSPKLSPSSHTLRGILTGVPIKEIDYEFHKRKGFAEVCDKVNP